MDDIVQEQALASSAQVSEDAGNDNSSILTDEDAVLERETVSSSVDNLPIEKSISTNGSPEGDIIEVSAAGTALPLDPSSRGKLRNRYVKPDGTIIDGKGLGRGRPGFKRGPRKSSILSQEVVRDDGTSTFTPSPGPQPRQAHGKRKRADSDVIRVADASEDEDDEDDEDEDDEFSRDSTPEYTPAASTTRSGRQSQKPASIMTPTNISSPSMKRSVPIQSKSSPSVKKHPKIKAKVYRGREQFALCEHCTRQHGPPGNVIVFCDACNKCWHQRCHDPKISKEIVADSKAEWFCSSCDKILHGKKKLKQTSGGLSTPSKATVPVNSAPPPMPPVMDSNMSVPVQMQMQLQMPSPPPQPLPPRYSLPLIPGMSLTLAQRKQYLNALPREKLIEIVLGAANLAPNMPIFETPLHLVPQLTPQGYPIFLEPSQLPPNRPFPPQQQPQMTARTNMAPPPVPVSAPTPPTPRQQSQPQDPRPVYSHPTAHMTSKPNTNPPPPDLTPDDEGYFDDYDEMALIYPKAGEGAYDMALPPESTDLDIMLEGPESRTFSHWVRGQGPIKTSVDACPTRSREGMF